MIAQPHGRLDAEHNAGSAPSLAHTLNNLLQVVNGNLELLSTKVQDEQLRGYIRNAQLAAEQITKLADDLNGRSPD
jgi:nitrogen-specific signal transduction histidine kinase